MNDWLDADSRAWPDLAGKRCVIIDGDNGVGKSTYIGPKIAGALNAKLVSVDNYLKGDSTPYLEQINYDDLRAEVLAASIAVIVEGLCMMKVMATIGLRYDYHIFVQRLMLGQWENETWLTSATKEPKSRTTKDLINYYRECRPHEKSDKLLRVELTRVLP